MKSERVSYDFITPSAAVGILESIYWKPAIKWHVDRIHVLKPIKFATFRTNEVIEKISEQNVRRSMKEGNTNGLGLSTDSNRTQRSMLYLKDVSYVIEAHFSIVGNRTGEDANPIKHISMFNRRASKGQCFHRPCLGVREFAAEFALLKEDEFPESSLDKKDGDFGWMLHSIDFQNNTKSRFFRANMVNGIIDVPGINSQDLAG
jgi:CRISPR-associated protein Cas5d